MLTLNEAGWDRIVRLILGVALLGLGWGGIVTGGWGWRSRPSALSRSSPA
jgi:hypothetical protein